MIVKNGYIDAKAINCAGMITTTNLPALRRLGRMRMRIISKEDFANFVDALIKDDSLNVIGVKSKGDKFAFGPLESASELRLDYDLTLLPPKKYFFPQRETLLTYDLEKGFSAQNHEAKPMVIIGVHPYDIVALLHMDEIFRETKSDPYYFEKRNSSI